MSREGGFGGVGGGAATIAAMSQMYQTQLPNGLHVVAEAIPGVQSLAMTLLSPAGIASQPADRLGVAPVLAEMLYRGAGDLDARQHSDALDLLGVQRSVGPATRYFRLGATMIGQRRAEALPLLLDTFRRPQLRDESLGPSVELSIQGIDALADEPQRRAMLELRHRHYPEPLGRSPLGQREHLEALTAQDVREYWRRRFVADGSILAFAGQFEWEALLAQVTELLGDWSGRAEPAVAEDAGDTAGGGNGAGGGHHLAAESSQVHIALAYPGPAETHPDRILQQAAAAVLSGGMSGRLFTEVREKRGLVYAVSASYHGQKDRGDVLAYAGTTTPRAQETLDVLVHELRRLGEGADASEFDRAVVGMKSGLVMQGESTSARAASIANDVHLYGRPLGLEDAAAEIESLTLDRLNAYLAEHPPGEMTVVTLGPEALRLPESEARASAG